jgi:hypothetical protein
MRPMGRLLNGRGYAIKGTFEKARSKGEGSNLGGSTGI